MEQRLGKYELVRHLATGGMGEVYLARQQGPAGFARLVVLKRLLPHLAKEPAFLQMFLNEARVVSMLSHPHVAHVHELGEDAGTWFLVMEYVHGRSLQQVLRTLDQRGRLLSPALAVRLVVQALRGLQHAHELRVDGRPAPVIHRDMSPDNILVGFNGVAKLIDFGIARSAETVSTTRTGTVKGKFAYMAPERFEGGSAEVDPRVDVWSMGIVAWECLVGRRPFRGPSDAALVGAILNTEPGSLSEHNPAVPRELEALVLRALEKDRARRFQSAEEFATALEGWLASTGQRVGEPELAALMKGLFGEEENPALARASLASAPLVPELATAASAPTVLTAHTPSPPRRRWPLVVGSAVAVSLGAAAFLAWRTEPPPRPAPPPESAPPAKPEVLVEEKAPTPPARPGRVSFRVKPWGEVWLGTEKLGVTPNVLVERPAGQYTFVIKHPDYPPKELQVQVLADSEVAVKVDLTAPVR